MADRSELRSTLLTLADQAERDSLAADVVLSRLDDVLEMLGMAVALENESVDDDIVSSLREIQHRVRMENAQEEVRLNVGRRPRFEVPDATLTSLVLSGITVRDIANIFAVSPSTIKRRMAEQGLR